MKVKYSNNSTRWDVILFDYIDDVPTPDTPEVDVCSGNSGVVSISISRSKASIQNAATIQVVGDLNPAYSIGNWVIIKSKIGKFIEKKDENFPEVSPLKEGLIKFIGQITTIQNNYTMQGNGLLTKKATIHIREWSSLLNIPVRIDATSVSSFHNQTNNALGRINLISNIQNTPKIDIKELTEKLIDPFLGAGMVLAIIGALNTNPETGLNLGEQLGEYDKVVSISKTTSRMPNMPQALIKYLELPDSTESDNAFATGFTNTLLGVMYETEQWEKSNAMEGYAEQPNDPEAFNGFFKGYDQLKQMYENYKDRPVKTNFFSSLGEGTPAWSLIEEHIDTTFSEAFTDIWYFRTKSGAVTSLPIIVLRDKPFALKAFLTDPENQIKHTKWTAYDNLPRVFVDDTLIQGVNTTNTFFNSPNFIKPDIQSAHVASSRSDDPLTVLTTAVHRIMDEGAINRFGTIEHFWNTVYSAPTSKIEGPTGEQVYVPWFEDVKKLMYYWHSLNYRFGKASLSLKDNNLPIMIGCNISFPMGKNVLCGHVEAVVTNFTISGDGLASTSTSVELSYLCRVKPEGDLTLLGPSGFTDLFDPDLADSEIQQTFKFPEFKIKIPDVQSLIPKLEDLLPKLKLPKVPFI